MSEDNKLAYELPAARLLYWMNVTHVYLQYYTLFEAVTKLSSLEIVCCMEYSIRIKGNFKLSVWSERCKFQKQCVKHSPSWHKPFFSINTKIANYNSSINIISFHNTYFKKAKSVTLSCFDFLYIYVVNEWIKMNFARILTFVFGLPLFFEAN